MRIPTFIQTLLVNPSQNHLLLMRHLKHGSAFYNRFTGFITNTNSQLLEKGMPIISDTQGLRNEARRVVEQHCNVPIKPEDLRMGGSFIFEELGETNLECPELSIEHQYVATISSGDATFSTKAAEKDGFELEWFHISELPFDSMPEDDRIWYPYVLANATPFSGRFEFTERKLSKYHLTFSGDHSYSMSAQSGSTP